LKIMNMTARLKTVALFAMLALVAAGCVGARQGVSWPALDSVQYNGETRIVVAYENRVELIDANNGSLTRLIDEEGDFVEDADGNRLTWVVEGSEFENAQFFSDPVVMTAETDEEERTLLFATYNNSLLEFAATNAQPVRPVGIALDDGVNANLVKDDKILYVPYRNQDLVAFDLESLEEIWRLDTEAGVWAAPLLHDAVLYIPSIDHNLYAVEAATGDFAWSTPVDLEGAAASTPLLYDDHLYIGSYSHKLFKITLAGEIVASYEGANWIWGTPAVFNNMLYYTDLSGNVYALNAETLAEVWVSQPAERGIRPAPIVTEDFVIAASRDGRIYWLDRIDGSVVFEREIEGRPEILSELLLLEEDAEAGVPEDMIVVGTVDTGRLVAAFALDNSLPIWVYGR